jgi:hypothetical protein
MSKKAIVTALPVWNGNPENLPESGKEFTYKGKRFTWRPCDCGNPHCRRPQAYNTDGTKNRAMTIRLCGLNQRDPSLTLLLRVGATMNEVVDADSKAENGDKGQAMVDLLERYADSAVASGRISEGEMTARMVAVLITGR